MLNTLHGSNFEALHVCKMYVYGCDVWQELKGCVMCVTYYVYMCFTTIWSASAMYVKCEKKPEAKLLGGVFCLRQLFIMRVKSCCWHFKPVGYFAARWQRGSRRSSDFWAISFCLCYLMTRSANCGNDGWLEMRSLKFIFLLSSCPEREEKVVSQIRKPCVVWPSF